MEPADLLSPAAPTRDLHSPAALLRADTEAVGFHGRESELSDLQAWCDNPPAGLSVRVLIGPGGQGKTRLARHLTHLRSRTGWVAGHLRSDLTDYDPPPDFATLRTEIPLLLVVDYAETRPRLLRRLITDLSSTRHRVRVLLLARSDGEWRTDALNAARSTRDLLKQASVVELPPFTPRAHPSENHPQENGPHRSRATAFRRAASDLARLLPRVATVPPCDWDTLAATVRPPDDLAQSGYGNALTLQLAALTSLLQQGPKPVEAAPTAPAEEIILDHEERFWADSAAAPAFGLTLSTSALADVVAAAALCGAAGRDEALRILGVVPTLPPDQVPGVAKWLVSLYPAEPGRYWGSLQPDRIAEYHASRRVIDHVLSIGDLLTAASPGQRVQLITVLARAAEAHYNAHRTADSTRVLQTVNTTLDAVSLHHDVLSSASTAIPKSRVTNALALPLSALLVDAGRQLAAENPADYEAGLARSLKNLGIRMSEAGQRAHALKAAEEAAEIYVRLAAENPAAYEPDLADSLDNLGSRLLEVGQRSDGLKAVRDAVKIQRVLAVENLAAYRPDLARSLNNLGIHLSEAGQRADALKATKEAVEIYGELAAENPSAYEPRLAQSLNNLGSHLSAAGQQSDALKATEKAVKIQRALAVENPAAYEPDLANSLNNLGIRLSMLGQQSDAVKPTEEAVDINRRLAAENPAAYEPDLALSLMNLGVRLWDVGQQSNSLTATRKAVDIYQRLAEDNPGAYEGRLADSLINLGADLSQAGQRTKALTATEKAVEIYRRLAEDNPAAYEADLANSLTHVCSRLSEAEHWKDALAANGQAVEIYRRYIAAEPARFGPKLRDALTWQAYLLTKLRRHRDAVEVRRWLTANAIDLHNSQS
ncbi:tetratricopeptide repeat protein [Streptomyces jietaisiensis]|uniref:tetratricopeptide repeat protein n=1 Tax=Streptomyces griseoaurantiacus TaxID=68213 RepID=UPI002E2A7317|nr:tetratricopeptide repeat protein [Streptomyces jietaisiensis]